MGSRHKIGIVEFGRMVFEAVNRHGRVTVDLRTIDDVYGNQIHHNPMYFPMPGMPTPCSTLDDFKQWTKAQNFMVIEPPDKFDQVVVFKQSVDNPKWDCDLCYDTKVVAVTIDDDNGDPIHGADNCPNCSGGHIY